MSWQNLRLMTALSCDDITIFAGCLGCLIWAQFIFSSKCASGGNLNRLSRAVCIELCGIFCRKDVPESRLRRLRRWARLWQAFIFFSTAVMMPVVQNHLDVVACSRNTSYYFILIREKLYLQPVMVISAATSVLINQILRMLQSACVSLFCCDKLAINTCRWRQTNRGQV